MECQVCKIIYGDNSENGKSIAKTGCCCHCWANKPEECEEISADWIWTTCVNCKKEIEYNTDLEICDECSEKKNLCPVCGEKLTMVYYSTYLEYHWREEDDHWSSGLIGDLEKPTGMPCGCRSWDFDELIEEVD